MDELAQALQRLAEGKAQEAGLSPEAVPYGDRIRRGLLTAIAEPHFRIAYSALACLQQLVRAAPAALHPMLDRLLPQLFIRTCDPKPKVLLVHMQHAGWLSLYAFVFCAKSRH